MKTGEQRINNIIGQLTGIKKMLTENKQDCLAVMTQLKAARSAISSLMTNVISEEFDRCLANSSQNDKHQLEQIFKEVLTKNNQ